jgi:hypothetical protein
MRSSVLNGPGHKAFTRTPSLACITASSRVRARTAPLLAVYAICGVAAPINATNEAVFITEPPPALMMAGIPYLQSWSADLQKFFITASGYKALQQQGY